MLVPRKYDDQYCPDIFTWVNAYPFDTLQEVLKSDCSDRTKFVYLKLSVDAATEPLRTTGKVYYIYGNPVDEHWEATLSELSKIKGITVQKLKPDDEGALGSMPAYAVFMRPLKWADI